jgi:hypothetical protein
LLGRRGTEAVGQARLHTAEAVLYPLGVGGGGIGVKTEHLAGDIGSLLAVLFERRPQRAVVHMGVPGRHLRAGVAHQALDYVLWDTEV